MRKKNESRSHDRFVWQLVAMSLVCNILLVSCGSLGGWGGSGGSTAGPSTSEKPTEKQPLLEGPLFPWPPPSASATAAIPSAELVASNGPTSLQFVDQELIKVLEHNGYFESSYYLVPSGFALVTKLEQIQSDGTSVNGEERWVVNQRSPVKFSLFSYIAALFRARPGYYRVIVFIVTNQPFTQTSVVVSIEESERWLSEGLNRLPIRIGRMEFTDDYACTALIYEFESPAEGHTPRIRVPGIISGHTHLVKAGIWEALENGVH